MPAKWLQAAGSALLTLLIAAIALPTAQAATKPYFRTNYGGPFVGGWYDSNTTPCSDSSLISNYQGPTYSPTFSNQYKGALMAFSDLGSRHGSSSNLDAFATGLIEGPTAAQPSYGFFTGLAASPPAPNGSRSLSFANADNFGLSAFWGGMFEGAAGLNSHCIPDYYATKRAGAQPAWSTNLNDNQSGQFDWGGGTISGGTLPANKKLIVFVDGNVKINGNITYGSNSISSVPKFALVVRGNIFIDPNVSRLDGWYIAQPDSINVAGTGIIWTCHDGVSNPSDIWMRFNCDSNDLDVYGALTAKQVNLNRIRGNLGAGAAEDVFFSAAMVLGGPFFEDDTTTITTSGTIQSLISLPPVF